MKLILDMEVGLSPVHYVLDGHPALYHKRGRSPLPNFRPIFIVAKRLDAGLGPGVFVLDGDPVTLLKKRAEPPRPAQFSAKFSAHVHVAKRLDGSR